MKKDQLPLFWDLQFNKMKECKKGKSRIEKLFPDSCVCALLFCYLYLVLCLPSVICLLCCVCAVLFSDIDQFITSGRQALLAFYKRTQAKTVFQLKIFLLKHWFCCVQLFPSGFFWWRWRRKSDIGHRRHCDESDNLTSCFCLLTLCKAWRYQTTMTAKLSDLPL